MKRGILFVVLGVPWMVACSASNGDHATSDSLTSASSPVTAASSSEASPLFLGMWPGETGEKFGQDPGSLAYTASEVGRMPQMILWYTSLGEAFPAADADQVVNAGSMPMITLQPGGSTVPDAAWTLQTILDHDHDADLLAWADGAKAWGKKFFLRFAHEMNGTWYPWGTGPGNVQGNTPEQYVRVWKYVRNLFQEEGATNAVWVWCPSEIADTATFDADYPGDDSVDWACFDAYNRGSLGSAGWKPMAQIFAPTYQQIRSFTNKPIVVGETSSVEEGGDKASWITYGMLDAVPAQMPGIRGIVWFDAIHTDQNGQTFDWRIDSSPSALAAFQQVAASPLYAGAVP